MKYEIVQFWKDTRNKYEQLRLRNRIRDNVRYSVIEEDNTITEYIGNMVIGNGCLEQIAAVDMVMSSTEFKNSKDDFTDKRLLIGPQSAFNTENGNLLDDYVSTDADVWYVVDYKTIINNIPNIINFKGHTARIKSLDMKEYMLVDNKLITYDDELVWKL